MGRQWGQGVSAKAVRTMVWALVVLLAVILALVCWKGADQAANAVVAEGQTHRLVTLKRGALADSVTVTGVVKSAQVASVTTQQMQPVKEIAVQVGDSVQEGDEICRLDTQELERQLAQKKRLLQQQENAAAQAREAASSGLQTAVQKRDAAYAQYEQAVRELEMRRAAFLPAQSSVRPYQEAYDRAVQVQQSAGAALNENAQLTMAQAAMAAAQAAVQMAADAQAQQQAQAQLVAAQVQLEQAQAQAQGLWGAYQAAQLEVQRAMAGLTQAKANSGYDPLAQAYAAADQAHLAARQAYDVAQQAWEAAEQKLQLVQQTAEQEALREAVQALEQQIEGGIIRATASGTVTALNVTVGAAAAGAPIATIQDTHQLRVAVLIDENEIQKVAVGQRVFVRSDATADRIIEGEVSQIAMTAAEKGGFAAEVAVREKDSGLRIGVSAKAEIIFAQKEAAFSVPYDAVQTLESGEQVIYVQKGSGYDQIAVTQGMQTPYYVEIIAPQLTEGMQVRVPLGAQESPFRQAHEAMRDAMKARRG